MSDKKNDSILIFILSITFVLLYSSGFVAVKLGFPFAQPLVFLVYRFGINALILLLFSFIIKGKWPSSFMQVIHISVAGLFLVGVFSIGTWISMSMNVPPATSALIVSLQPLAVAVTSHFIYKTNINLKQWLGLLLGLLGVILVLGKNACISTTYLDGILMSFLGLLGLSVGNLYQKRFCHNMNILTGGVIQSISSGVACLILALFFERFTVQWSGQFIFSLIWMSVVVSLCAVSCLYILLRKGESYRVSSLFYLIPVITAFISYFVFGTKLNAMEFIGIAIATLGVSLINIKFKTKKHLLT